MIPTGNELPDNIMALLEEAFPDRLPVLSDTTTSEALLASYWRRVGQREVVDYLKAQRDSAASLED